MIDREVPLSSNKRVLVVDSDKYDREFFRILLEESQQSFDIIEDVQCGIDRISLEGYSIFFLNFNLPVINGLELLRKIKSSNPTSQVYMIVDSTSGRLLKQAMKLGAKACLKKPFNIKQILCILEK